MAGIKPGNYDPQKPDIELFDYKSKKRYGLKLDGQGALQIGTISNDDSVFVRSVGKRVGDFDEQRSWKAGRGIENLSSNAEAFWDSQNAWTMSEGFLHQTLLWRIAKGIRVSDSFLPDNTHSLTWLQLLGSTLYASMSWTCVTGFAADYARMWIRRVGTPGTLTFKLHSDSAGSPGTVLQTVTVTTSDITGTVSVFQLFNWTGTETITSSSVRHISIYGASTDNKNNHWEVGAYKGGTTGKQSTDGSSWSSSGYDPYFWICDTDIKRKWFSFFLDGAMYIVDSKDDGNTASNLFINGDRGKATSSTSTTLTDSGKVWTTNKWAGAYVRIVRGTGVGQIRAITSNTSNILTVPAFDVALSTDSEYIIYGTEWFTEIGTTGLGVVTGQPAVINQIVYFPQGPSTNVRVMVWNPATPAHSFSNDGTNKANFIISFYDQVGQKVLKALNNSGSGGNNTIATANATAWATSPTALVYGTAKPVGTANNKINSITPKDSSVYIFKEDGVWNYTSGVLISLTSGVEKTADPVNGLASVSHQQFLYYSWLHSLIRIYGSSHDDVGQDWSGYGLPDGREGTFSSMDSYTSLLMVGVDAGTGTSSVLGFDGIGWHEILRAYDSNKRIRMVKVQTCPDTRNRTWIDVGGDLIFQEMPYKKGSPRLDSGVRYMHEAVVESSAIDMGTASGLPKYVKELTVFTENLGNGNVIYVDYLVDDDVHTTNWTEAGAIYDSPEGTIFLGLNNIRKFTYRLRIMSSDNTSPVRVIGVTPNGYARTPYKMVWTLRCRANNIVSQGKLVKPDILMRWLLDNARFPGKIEMRSQYQLAHNFNVIIHPPRMFPYKAASAGQAEESIFTITLEEA